ncbi:MAG: hypothetical protein WKF79_12860, partial [Nocardioides sp.]
FDPHGDNSSTGVSFPSLLNVTSTTLTPDDHGQVGLQVSCGAGSEGCSGTVTVNAGGQSLGSVPYTLREQSTDTLTLPTPVPVGSDEVSFQVTSATGIGPTSPVTLPVQ